MRKSEPQRKPILLLGVGNLLQADDGVGVHAVREMMNLDLPDSVEIVDGGTAGIDLSSLLEDRTRVVVIDAVDGGMEPGTLFRFAPEEIALQPESVNSLHQIGLLEAVRMAQLVGRAPGETVIIGVQPAIVDWGMSLSEPIRNCLPRIISEARKEIDKAVSALNREVAVSPTEKTDSLLKIEGEDNGR
jgi:hydrogenase maturation protease